MEDSYSKLINIIKQHGAAYNPPSIDIGVVISNSPLTIKIGDLQLTKNNLLIADFLLPNYKRKMSIPQVSASGSTSNGQITSVAIPDGELSLTDGLKENDIVACLATEDRQRYIVLCRVVKV
ncbi:DUF2577 domain-containing protein [Clostridiaceae bacterium UIB06]|uniref:DUF2577 domain-containing protein n=1 Tax=Clostridium thailandense TaxID=2794346 RepID=A0A949TM78_9CLOT|nr:DUF2577 domain-containing protein [Clostridium thailandense]MBV7275454.1 DUF2577 domain-containing protein [Clostridium thailandense]MCH5136685.1 DUF2577 domain-containing protein [Clostridiaceae bacterium UIB06]